MKYKEPIEIEDIVILRDGGTIVFTIISDDEGWRRSEYATPDGSHLTVAAYDALSRYTRERVLSVCDSA